MRLMNNIPEKLFSLIAFSLGTWGAVYNISFTVLIGVALLYNMIKLKGTFFPDLKKERFYIAIPVFFILYLALHTVVALLYWERPYSPSYGTFESLFSFFLLTPLYVLSVRSFMTVRLVKRFLFLYCVGVFSYNLLAFLTLTYASLFTHPLTALAWIYESRFAFVENKFGGYVYLEAQAVNLSVAAIIACFFIIVEKKLSRQLFGAVAFFFFLFFLSFTVTKSAILAFAVGFLILCAYVFYKLSLKYKCLFIGILCTAGVVAYVYTPHVYLERWEQAKNETEDVIEGKMSSGASITPRVSLLKACFDHLDCFAVWGLGVYSNRDSKQWYLASENQTIGALTHSHNSFLQYWMIGGICGLIFVFSWFVVPIYRMVRDKRFSFFILSVIIVIFIDNNSTVLLIISDSTTFIVFFLSMFYFYRSHFYTLERGNMPIEST